MWTWIGLIISALAILGAVVTPVFARSEAVGMASTSDDGNTEDVLSAYWSSRVRRWEPIITQEAQRRELDPDFLASLVWMESRGDPTAVGPVGAVGLMQVMSREAGFEWRPSEAELKDPAINLFWGTRTLSTVVGQGDGDIFNALAAYNGGWDQIMYRGPTIFATTILRDYARAVANREDVFGHWIGMFAVMRTHALDGPIWVVDSDRDDVYLSRNENVLPDGTVLIPDIPPTARVASCVHAESGEAFQVGFWLYSLALDQWVGTEVAVKADHLQSRGLSVAEYPDAYFIPLDERVDALRTREPPGFSRSWRLAPVSLSVMPGVRVISD